MRSLRTNLCHPRRLWLFLILFVGCAAQRTTRMSAADLSDMAAAMAQSLSRSDALARRGPGSPPWVVSIDQVANLTSDVMTPSEQWYVIAKLRSALPMRSLADGRNIVFVIPAEQARRMRNDPELDTFDTDFALERRPTHQMTATFRSLTRAAARERTETYYCEFELLDLATGLPVWTDRFEYKRSAKGHIWD